MESWWVRKWKWSSPPQQQSVAEQFKDVMEKVLKELKKETRKER